MHVNVEKMCARCHGLIYKDWQSGTHGVRRGQWSPQPEFERTNYKCTFCLQRTRIGRYPACAAVCPTGARKFGNLKDPDSEVRKIIEQERVYVLKQDLGTVPKFYYVFAK